MKGLVDSSTDAGVEVEDLRSGALGTLNDFERVSAVDRGHDASDDAVDPVAKCITR